MSNIVKYETGGQEITLTPEIVKRYLVSGDPNKVTNQEIMMFLQLCKFQKLNPFLREVYLIKYGNEPAQMVTGKETFLKRAYRHPRYRGHKTGISDDGKTAWAEVYVDGYVVPIRVEVDYEEYVGRKKDGTVTKIWKEKPKTMLKKVALVQALREAFPEDFGGLYSQEEINTIQEPLPEGVVEVDAETTPQFITPEQVDELQKELKELDIDHDAFLAYLDVGSLEEITTDLYPKAKRAIETKRERIGNEEKKEKPPAEKPKATQAQIKKIMATVKELGWTDEDFKKFIKVNYGVGSRKDLTKEQASQIIEKLEVVS